jgi:hypothetical protein
MTQLLTENSVDMSFNNSQVSKVSIHNNSGNEEQE